MPKISIFAFLLELQNGMFQSGELILVASLLSLIVGTVLGLSQIRIKRLLTYSTISHVGFLLLALAINNEESVESFLFYLFQYSLTNLNVFLVLLAFGYAIYNISAKTEDISLIQELQGQFTKNPLLSLSFALCLFSIAGIPPLIGFFAKQIVLYSSIHAGHYFMSIIAIIPIYGQTRNPFAISFYVVAMLFLIFDLEILLVFPLASCWEGIGISSYLLINFWFTRIQANKSAIKALVVNRVGDMFLSVAFFALLFTLGNFDYSTVFSVAPFINETVVVLIGLLLLLAAMGACTALFAASTGLLQNDLKRVIAYSTCSQMGYLFMACGLSQYNVALFHLVNHAFFKALLFLAAGAVLHATYDQQDQRRLGGLIGFLPFTYVAILIGSLSLIAVPWITGFYSKDLILEVAYGQYQFSGHVAYWLGTISACLTAFYSLRLISLTFITYPNASKSVYMHTHDAPFIVIVPLLILSLFAIFFGYVAKDLFVGIGSDFSSSVLFTHPSRISLVEAEFGLPQIVKLLPAIGTFAGAGLALYLYHVQQVFTVQLTDSTFGRSLYKFFNGKYYIDVIYNHYVMYKGLNIGYTISKILDRGVIELLGPQGLSTSFTSSSESIAKLDTGNLTDYALYMGVGLISLTGILLVPTVFYGVELLPLVLTSLIIINTITKYNNTRL
ncbi:UNVERIFIED_CONTAM: NADH-ubiquinone oxidoreductase chain 5 [Trichonephila clavipes]